MKNKKTRIFIAFVLALVLQVSCHQSSRPLIPTPILAEVPKLLVRGEKHRFSVETSPGVECHAGVAYYDLNDKWNITDLPTIESDQNGICEWTWVIPEDAKDGLGEFRGYIQEKEESTNIFPATFCIGLCP